jgi:hypothetical protein
MGSCFRTICRRVRRSVTNCFSYPDPQVRNRSSRLLYKNENDCPCNGWCFITTAPRDWLIDTRIFLDTNVIAARNMGSCFRTICRRVRRSVTNCFSYPDPQVRSRSLLYKNENDCPCNGWCFITTAPRDWLIDTRI